MHDEIANLLWSDPDHPIPWLGHQVCATYPRGLVVPSHVPDEVLAAAAKHRRYGRMPALTYVHDVSGDGANGAHGARIVRCAQPLAGPRSRADEFLVAALCIPNHTISWAEYSAMPVEDIMPDPPSAPASLFSQFSQTVLASVAAAAANAAQQTQQQLPQQTSSNPNPDYYIYVCLFVSCGVVWCVNWLFACGVRAWRIINACAHNRIRTQTSTLMYVSLSLSCGCYGGVYRPFGCGVRAWPVCVFSCSPNRHRPTRIQTTASMYVSLSLSCRVVG